MEHNIKVLLFVESRYKVNRGRIKSTVSSIVKEHGVTTPAEVSVAIIGDRKMKSINKKYRGKDNTTNVLSFPLSEGESTVLPTDILRLGDVIISYPQVIKEAAEEEVLVDEKIDELVGHGVLHLMGIHHEEN